MMHTQTENGDCAFATSQSANLDFFTRIVRKAPLSDYAVAFGKAMHEAPETAIKVLLNLRDVRGGKGEKLIPCVLMVLLKLQLSSASYEALLKQFIHYGCWKDLLRILEIETGYHDVTNFIELQLIANQLQTDYTLLTNNPESNFTISLCAKWAPSEKTHYNLPPLDFATRVAKLMHCTPKQYRLQLTALRKHLMVLEMLLSTQQYDKIDFSKLPAVAQMKTKRAFNRDGNADNVVSDGRKQLHLKYSEYLAMLAENKTKVNVKGIQPHELVSQLMNTLQVDPLIESQWQTIRENVKSTGVFNHVTAVVDVSGSMQGEPMQVAIALGILVAELTEGIYQGQMITFHEEPSWFQLTGKTLLEQVRSVRSAPWGGSTNLRKVFDLILETARREALPADTMVKTLFIFTDMQFNQCDCSDRMNESTLDYGRRVFAEAGYVMPNIVCWNLRASSSKTIPAEINTPGLVMLSGFSSELLKCVLTGKDFNPQAMMRHVLEPYTVDDVILSSRIENWESVDLVTLQSSINKSQIKKSFKENKKTI